MFNIHNIYDLYIRFSLKKIEKLKKENLKHIDNFNILKDKISKYEIYIKKYCNIDITSIYKFTITKDLNKLNFPIYPVYDNGKEINFKALKLYIEKYIEYNKIITTNLRLISKYKKEIVSKNIYIIIIEKFNKKIIDKIVNNNLNFSINFNFGSIGIYKIFDERKQIDWGKSTKNKNKILKEGKIPYIKADAEGNKDYKGVPWIVYRHPLDFLIFWKKSKNSRKYNPMLNDYSFIPARGVSSFVSKLGEFKKDREKALLTYTRMN